MNKFTLKLLVLILFISFGINSQAQDLSRQINGRAVNFNSSSEMKRTPNMESEKFMGEYYFVMFIEDFSNKESENLQNEGITIHKCLGNNMYWVTVKEESLSNISSSKSILGFTGSSAINKFESNLLKPELPEFVLTEDDDIRLIVHFSKNLDREVVRESLRSKNCKAIKVSETFPFATFLISKDKYRNLSNLPWIISINAGGRKMELYSEKGTMRHGGKLYNYENPDSKLTGEGVVVGLWDDNVQKHMDFMNRITIHETRFTEPTDHAIHTTGILGGAGLINPAGEGEATDVYIHAYNFDGEDNDDELAAEEMIDAAYNYNISITSNSYGYYNGGGNVFPYLPNDAYMDQVANHYPNLLHVVAIGNNRAFFDYYTATWSAKNILSVGNIDFNGSVERYSSYGPTAGGHLFPHITAYGTDVFSTSFLNSYVEYSGTSMSTPLVSGAAAKLVQLYRDIYGGEPSSSLLKAVMCNTAVDMNNAGPDYTSGYGMLHQYNATKSIENEYFIEDAVEVSGVEEYTVTVPKGVKEFRVMVVWNDPWSYPTAENPLINNLDIEVEKDGETFLPWVLDPANPELPATKGVNVLDNMEQVLITDPAEGTYTIKVKATEINEPDANNEQKFAIAYEFIKPELTLITPMYEVINGASECFISWFSLGLEGDINVQLSKDGGQTFETIDKSLPENNYFSFELPENFDFDYQVRIQQGGTYSVSKIIKALKVPEVTATQTSNTEAQLTWQLVEGANKYVIYTIKEGDITEMARTSGTTYNITNLKPEEIYYAVQAYNSEYDIYSQRSVAVKPDIEFEISTLPFFENFENGGLEYFTENANISILRYDEAEGGNTSIHIEGVRDNMTGYSYSPYTPNKFDTYPELVSSIESGKISIPAGERAMLAIDVRLEQVKVWMGHYPMAFTPYFRAVVNGQALTELRGGDQIGDLNLFTKYEGTYNPELQGWTFFDFHRYYYDLSEFAGQEIKIDLQALVPHNTIVELDNISVELLKDNDIAIIDKVQIKSGINLEPQDVSVSISNFGTDTITSFDLKYVIDAGTSNRITVEESFTDTIAPLSTLEVTFAEKAVFSTDDYSHTVTISNANTDGNINNDFIVIKDIDSYRPQEPARDTRRDAILVDTAIYFTDMGSDRYTSNRIGAQTEFKPADPTKVLRAEYESFAISDGDEFRIFSGNFDYSYPFTDHDTVLLAKYEMSTDVPVDTTSISPDGGFLFFWRNWSEGPNEWKIKISQVDPIILNDIKVRNIIEPITHTDLMSPTPVTAEFWNFGHDSIETIIVNYEVDGVVIDEDTLNFDPKLAPNKSIKHTFDSLANLTTFGQTYELKVNADLEGDEDLESNTLTRSIKNTYPLTRNAYTPAVYLYNMYFEDYFYQAPYWYSYDNTDIVFDVEYNNEYTIDIHCGGAAPGYQNAYEVLVQVDWDENGAFEEIETVAWPLFNKKLGQNKANLIIPNDATPGKKTMRILTRTYSTWSGYRIGNETDFSLNLTGTPTEKDVAIVSDNLLEFSEPTVLIPQVSVKQIGADNNGFDISLSIGDNYTEQFLDTVIDVNTTTIFEFPAIDLNDSIGVYDVSIQVTEENDVTPDDNVKSSTINVYTYEPTYFAQKTGISLLDFDEPNMNVFRQKTEDTDKLSYHFGTYAKDSFFVYKRVKPSFSPMVSLIKYDGNLENEELIYNYGYYFNDIRGVAYSDHEDQFFSITSTNIRHNDTYVIELFNRTNNSLERTDTIKAGGNNLKLMAGLASDTEGNLYTIYRPQNILCRIIRGSGEVTGIAIIPEDLENTDDIALELDKNTGDIYIGVDEKIYVVKPLSRMAEYVKDFPSGVWGLGFKYDLATANSIAGLRGFRVLEQRKPAEFDIENKTINVEIPWNQSFTDLTVDLITINGSTVKINDAAITSMESQIDLISSATMVVTSNDGVNSEQWTINASQRNKTELISFGFEAANNTALTEDITATISGDRIIVDVPSDVDISDFVATFTTSSGSDLYYGSDMLTSGTTGLNYDENLVLTVKSDDYIDQVNFFVSVNRINDAAYISNFMLLSSDNEGLDSDYEAIIDGDLILFDFDINTSMNVVARFECPEDATVVSNTGVQISGETSVLLETGTIYTVVSQSGNVQVHYTVQMGQETTGMKPNLVEDVVCYPNPSNGIISITGAANTMLKIVSLTGQVVLNTNILTSEQQIDLTHLPKGIYVVEVSKDNEAKHLRIILE